MYSILYWPSKPFETSSWLKKSPLQPLVLEKPFNLVKKILTYLAKGRNCARGLQHGVGQLRGLLRQVPRSIPGENGWTRLESKRNSKIRVQDGHCKYFSLSILGSF